MVRILAIFVIVLSQALPVLHAQKQLTVEDIFGTRTFSGKSLDDFQWIPNSQKFSYTEGLSIWVYDMLSRERTKLLDSTDVPVFRKLKRVRRVIPENHIWSTRGDALLFNSGTDLYLYTVPTRALRQLTDDPDTETLPAF